MCCSLKDATREIEHRSAIHSAPSIEVCYTLLVYLKFDLVTSRALAVQWLERPM